MNSDNIDFVTCCIGYLSRCLGYYNQQVYQRLKTSGILADLIFYTDNHNVKSLITLSFITKHPFITLSFITKHVFITLSFITKHVFITLSFNKVNTK